MNNPILVSEVIEGLIQLSCRNEQERLWLSDGSTGEISSFSEAICGVFDDGGVSRAIESGVLPQELQTLFGELSELIKLVPEEAVPQETISHPAMKDVRRISVVILERLQILE